MQSEEHSLPAVYAAHLLALLERWDVGRDELCVGVVSPETLADPAARLPIPTMVELIERARRLTAEPGLGVLFGLHMRISAHGYLGFAAMTASNAREAIELAIRFVPTRTTAIGFRLRNEGKTASLFVDEHADFGPSRDAIMMAIAVGIWQMGAAVTGRELHGSAEFAFPRPDYYDRFLTLGVDAKFEQPANRLIFDPALLDLPLTLADREAAQLAREQCERALEALRGVASADTVPRVRGLIAASGDEIPSLELIAAKIHVSARTLKRKLAAEGTAFSTLVEEHQRERAQLLLRSKELSIDEIASRLGYSDTTNFIRAFRRWTGTTPAAYRRS